MKKSLSIALIVLLLVAGAAGAENSQPCAVYLILDTSWSCEQAMPDFRSLARQSVVSLLPGDYIEVLSAQTDQPRICLAQSIKAASTAEFREIHTVLNTIKSGFLRDASIAQAVEFVLNRIKLSQDKTLAPRLIFVFTDGQLKGSDARRLAALYPRLTRQQVLLYMTGRNHTSRQVLIAANQGKLTYSLLSEANPAQWLREQRLVNEESPAALARREALPATPEPSQPSAPPRDPTLAPPAPVQEEAANEPSAESPAVVPAPPLEKAAKAGPPEELSARPVPARPSPATPTPRRRPGVTSFSSLKERVRALVSAAWPWMLGLAILLGIGLAVFLLAKYRQARIWAAKLSHLKKSPPRTADRVIVRMGDRIQHLGRLRQIRRVTIGRDPKNTVRLHHPSVADRHLRLDGKQGGLWLKNLSAKPAAVNGIPWPPGKSARLPLPSVVTLSEAVTIHIALQKTPAMTAPGKEAVSHDEQTQ